jgi:hypothetical protein
MFLLTSPSLPGVMYRLNRTTMPPLLAGAAAVSVLSSARCSHRRDGESRGCSPLGLSSLRRRDVDAADPLPAALVAACTRRRRRCSHARRAHAAV